MTPLTAIPSTSELAPVALPRRIGLELLLTQAAQAGCANGLKLVYTPASRRSGTLPTAFCPCDHGPGNCVTAVTLTNVRLKLEGWLLTEFWAGQCPHCRRVYWA